MNFDALLVPCVGAMDCVIRGLCAVFSMVLWSVHRQSTLPVLVRMYALWKTK